MSTKRFLAVTISLLVVLSGCGDGSRNGGDDLEDPRPISVELEAELEGWLSEHGSEPCEYVIGLFADHDVVLLGEQHRIRHDALFVQELLPRVHAAGVTVFATEFARREDQRLLDSLVVDTAWREDLGREIIFRQFMPWGYREYVDILKAVWKVNLDRPRGSAPIRVLGLNNSYDYTHFRSESDWDDPEIWKLVTAGQTEEDWAEPVLDAVRGGAKVLLHSGIHHAFTGYVQPRVQDAKFLGVGQKRLGNFIREALGSRAVTVFLHAPWNGPVGYNADFVHPADGRLDAFMLSRTDGPFPVGFDVEGSPLADLHIEEAVYKHGHEPFTLSGFCDGWIYTKPVSEYEPVTYIEDWIDDANLSRARMNAMNPRWRDFSVDEMHEGCKSYMEDFRRFFGRLR